MCLPAPNFYYPKRKLAKNGMLSPVEYEMHQTGGLARWLMARALRFFVLYFAERIRGRYQDEQVDMINKTGKFCLKPSLRERIWHMVQFNAENERLKREYLGNLKEADGKDEVTLDQVAASLRDFETAVAVKPFKAFHRDWGRRHKSRLEKCRNVQTGKPLSLTTRGSRLRQGKAFFKWLACQPGFKSRISFSDVEYFNSNAKDSRAAHAQRPIRYPSIAQCDHAFRLMPEGDEVQRRNKAMFVLLMLTCARVGAAASLRIGHVDLVEGMIPEMAQPPCPATL